MLYDDDTFKARKREFKRQIGWFEEEFEKLFGNKTHLASQEDMDLANTLLDRLSEIINQYQEEEDQKLLYILTDALNRIEKNYPELFLDLKNKGFF